MTSIDTTPSQRAKPPRAIATANWQPQAARSNTKAAPTKSDIVSKLLARPKGATVVEVSAATGWQAHSVRAFFSGLRKKGSVLEREKRKDGDTSYRLTLAAGTPTAPPAAATVPALDEDMAAATGDEA